MASILRLMPVNARTLTIDGFEISDASDCYVIAEIGHNHQGSLEQAHELFRAAKDAGPAPPALLLSC